MIRYLLLSLSFVFVTNASTNPHFPESSTNTYAILGGDYLGVLIPVADYQLKQYAKSSDPIVSLSIYEHVQDPSKEFTLIFDPFDGPCDVEFFAKWCLSNDNFVDMQDFLKRATSKRSESLIAGKEGDIPVIRLVSQYEDFIVDQLFLTVKNNGYCLLARYPAKEEHAQSKYWDFFFSNMLPWIEKTL